MRLFTVILFLISPILAVAQLPDYHVQLFDESFGVRTNEVRKVVTDQQGFVWILQDDRAQRFDGKRIDNYVLGGPMESMVCDEQNNIWVTTANRLFLYNRKKNNFSQTSIDTFPEIPIVSIDLIPGKGLWILTTHGYYQYDGIKHKFRSHEDPALNSLAIRGRVANATKDAVFFLEEDSIVNYNFRTKTRFTVSKPNYGIRIISPLSKHQALVSVWRGKVFLYDFLEKSYREIDMEKHLSNVHDYFIHVFDAIPIRTNELLLATTKGLFRYNLTEEKFTHLKLFHKGRPLEGNQIYYDLHVTEDQTIWCAYRDFGLVSFKLNPDGIGLIRSFELNTEKAWDNHVRHFAEDDKNNLWFSSYNGFVQWNLKTGYIQPYFAMEGATDQLAHPSVRGIVYDGRNLILGPTADGVWLYNPILKKYNRPSFSPDSIGLRTSRNLEGNFIDHIYTLKNGDHIVAGNSNCFLIKGQTYQVSKLPMDGKTHNYNFIFQDKQQHIWIGSAGSTFCLDTSYHLIASIENKLTFGKLNGICAWQDDKLIAIGKGLYTMQLKDTTITVSKLDTLFDKLEIHIVYLDSLDRLWLATSEGLFRYGLANRELQSFSNFEHIEGNSFYPSSVHRASNGLLYMGSSRGIIYFNPEKAEAPADSLHVFVTNVMVNEDDSTYAASAPFRLKYFQNNISFDFVAPYYGNAIKLKYKYRLQGLSDNWISNGNDNTARFHMLPAGHYQFEAAASINGVDWNYSDDKIMFTVHPPFWLTWWFYVLMGALVISILYSIYLYQLKKKLEVERLRTRIARDLHDDIGSTLSNIHIISSMAMKKQTENGSGQIFSKIKDSSKAMLDNMQDIVWAINPQNDTLEQVLSRMKEFAGELCESAGMDYRFDMDPNLENIKLPIHQRKELFLVFKEALNNAVKYSNGTTIVIELLLAQKHLLILRIEDNGKGFEVTSVNGGNGLRNMKERAKQVRGQVMLTSSPGKGTKVELQMPIT